MGQRPVPGMEKTIKCLNELEKRRIVEKYAIGGAIAMLFYAEPVLTYDLGVFCFLPPQAGKIISLKPIYDYLKKKGYSVQKEHVLIEGIPVQFIPAYNELVAEALERAAEIKFKRTKTRVVRAEHLLAIMLQTDRPKDRTRITQLLEEAKVDADGLANILNRHGLAEKWQTFRKRYYDEEPS
jgi:hypothetical protein